MFFLNSKIISHFTARSCAFVVFSGAAGLNGLLLLQDLTMETELEAVNGRRVRALEVFAHALRFFREHALKVNAPSVPSRPRLAYGGFPPVLSPGGEGPVVHRPGGGPSQMGDHRPGRVATTCQTVHEGGCVPGRLLRAEFSIPKVFFLHSKPLCVL